MPHEPQNVEEAVASLEHLAEGRDRVTVGDMLDELGERSFGPLLVIIALLDILPVGSIPGLPTVLAMIGILLAAQLVAGHDHVWLPQWLQRRAIGADKLAKGLGKMEKPAAKIDRTFRNRLENFTTPFWQKLAGMAVILLCLTVPPLELIPLATTAPMLAIAAYGVALTVRDGLLMLLATVLSAAAVGISGYFVATSLLG
jgi:hypothetical protein